MSPAHPPAQVRAVLRRTLRRTADIPRDPLPQHTAHLPGAVRRRAAVPQSAARSLRAAHLDRAAEMPPPETARRGA